MLSVLMQVFVVFSLITVLWCVYGYSLAFTEGNAFFGSFDRLFLKGTFDSAKGEFAMAATFSKGTPIPELVFVAFQATFAAITVCLILGAFAERIEVLGGAAVRGALVHVRLPADRAHGLVLGRPGCVHGGQRRRRDQRQGRPASGRWGALDFAGGTVVHINAGVAGLVGAYVIGKRIGYGKEAMAPHNLPMTMIGASLLWIGWFGFNAGSALEANNSAALAFINTYLATACAVLSWTFGEWMFKGKPSMLGAASGAVAGLVAITPAAGNVGIPGAFVIGTAGGRRLPVGRQRPEADAEGRRLARRVRRARGRRHPRRAADRHLRVAGPRRSGRRRRLGHRQDGASRATSAQQSWIQAKAVGITIVWSGVVAFIAYKIVDMTVGLRVPEEEEREGLDITLARRVGLPHLAGRAGLRAGGLSPRPRVSAGTQLFPDSFSSVAFGARLKAPRFFASVIRDVTARQLRRLHAYNPPPWSLTSRPRSPVRCRTSSGASSSACPRSSAGCARSGRSTRCRSTRRSTCATRASSSRRSTPTSSPAASTI